MRHFGNLPHKKIHIKKFFYIGILINEIQRDARDGTGRDGMRPLRDGTGRDGKSRPVAITSVS